MNENHLLVNWCKYKSVITVKYNVVGCKLLNAISVRRKYTVDSRIKSLFEMSTSMWHFKI